MDFAALVLMEVDKDNKFIREREVMKLMTEQST